LQPAGGGTGVTTTTGSGSAVLNTSPTLVTPALGTPASGNLTSCTGYTTANLSGTISNAQLANSSVTVNSTAIALGGSATITAVNPNALTIGTGLSGTSYNGSSAVTIANAGVTSVAAGTGIGVSGSTGGVTISNSGVTSVAAGTGISVSATTGGVTITNSSPGTTYTGGTGISVSGSTITNTAPAVTAGEAKAWMNYNGTAYSIRASYNVSSVTHNSGGNYTINFTTAFSDTNYAMVAICSLSYPNTGGFSETVMPGTTSTGSQVILTGVDHSGTQFQRDEPYICAAFFR